MFVLPVSLQNTGGFAVLWWIAHANFASVFAVCPQVGCNLDPGGCYTHAKCPDFPDFSCAWWLPGFNLHVTGG